MTVAPAFNPSNVETESNIKKNNIQPCCINERINGKKERERCLGAVAF